MQLNYSFLIQIFKIIFMGALLTALQLGGGTVPISRHARADSTPSCSQFTNECDVATIALTYGASNTFDFIFSISVTQSINSGEEVLMVNDSISNIDKIQNLDVVSTGSDPCGYRLSPSAGSEREHPFCSWSYDCDYNARRIPQNLCRAQCAETCLHCPYGYTCQPVHYKVPVLKLKEEYENCNPYLGATNETLQWNWVQEIVPVSCACQITKTDAGDCQGLWPIQLWQTLNDARSPLGISWKII